MKVIILFGTLIILASSVSQAAKKSIYPKIKGCIVTAENPLYDEYLTNRIKLAKEQIEFIEEDDYIKVYAYRDLKRLMESHCIARVDNILERTGLTATALKTAQKLFLIRADELLSKNASRTQAEEVKKHGFELGLTEDLIRESLQEKDLYKTYISFLLEEKIR